MKKRIASILTVIILIMCLFPANASAAENKIHFRRETLDIYLGQSVQLELKEKVDQVSYKSSDENIISVSINGRASALSAGSSVITATDSSGNQAYCTINVISGEAPTKLELNTRRISLREGESYTDLKATVYPEYADDPRVKYFSSDEKIVKVDKNGVIKAIKSGTAVVTVESSSAAVSQGCIVHVSPRTGKNASNVDVSGVLYSIAGEKKVGMLVTVDNGKESFESITDADGKFYFDDINPGSYTLAVYASESSAKPTATGQLTVGSNNITMTCIINKSELVPLYQDTKAGTEQAKDVTLSKTSLSLETGSAYDMTFKVSPSNAAVPEMKGKSSNEKIATVDVDGRITAVSEGTAKITFKSADGKISKTCVVNVVKASGNTYSWLIITIELSVIFLILLIFTVSYRRFVRKKEKAEGLRENNTDDD